MDVFQESLKTQFGLRSRLCFLEPFLILLFGVLKLSLTLGLSKAIVYGFNPFIVGGVIKILLGGIVGWWLKERMLLSEEKGTY